MDRVFKWFKELFKTDQERFDETLLDWTQQIEKAEESYEVVSEDDYHKTIRYKVPQSGRNGLYFITQEQTLHFTPLYFNKEET